MNSAVIFTFVITLYARTVVGESTDVEEKFIADELTKAIDLLASEEGDLKPTAFYDAVNKVLDSKAVKETSEKMINKAIQPQWKRDHLLEGMNQMVSPKLSEIITGKLGTLEQATQELTKDEEFKENYLSAGQYIKEALNDELNDIEDDIIDEIPKA